MLARALSRYLPEPRHAGVPVGAAFGIILVWGGTQMQSRVTRRLDRAFFRSAYDTRQILVDLAAKTRTASNREQLAELLRHEIVDALHPSTLAIYFRQSDGEFVTTADVPAEIRASARQTCRSSRTCGSADRPWEIVPSARRSAGAGDLAAAAARMSGPDAGTRWAIAGTSGAGPEACRKNRIRAKTGDCWTPSPTRRAAPWKTSGSPRPWPNAWRQTAAQPRKWISHARCRQAAATKISGAQDGRVRRRVHSGASGGRRLLRFPRSRRRPRRLRARRCRR